MPALFSFPLRLRAFATFVNPSKTSKPMHNCVSLNGEIIVAGDATIPALTAASLYGKGVFTTVAICVRVPFLWEKHWGRLADSSPRLGIDISGLSEESVKLSLERLMNKNSLSDGRARITIFDNELGGLWRGESERKIALLITTAEQRDEAEKLRLTVSPFFLNSKSPLAGVKTCNYLENILAADEAKKRGFDEAIRLNERGEIVSACMANIFWQKGGELFTPSLKTGCLPGTTRAYVLENLKCFEVEQGLGDIRNADAVFLTSAGIGIVEISEFEGRKLTSTDGSITGLWPHRT